MLNDLEKLELLFPGLLTMIKRLRSNSDACHKAVAFYFLQRSCQGEALLKLHRLVSRLEKQENRLHQEIVRAKRDHGTHTIKAKPLMAEALRIRTRLEKRYQEQDGLLANNIEFVTRTVAQFRTEFPHLFGECTRFKKMECPHCHKTIVAGGVLDFKFHLENCCEEAPLAEVTSSSS